MEYHSKVKGWFFEAVRTKIDIDPELRDLLLNRTNPKIENFLNHLDQQVKGAQAKLLRKGKSVKPDTIKGFIFELTDFFIKNLETEAKRRHESDLARLAREAKEQEIKDMESTLAGKPSGIFEEAGVLIDETSRQDQVLPQT